MAENLELIQYLDHFQSNFIHLEPRSQGFLERKQSTFPLKKQCSFGAKMLNSQCQSPDHKQYFSIIETAFKDYF